MKWRYNMIKNQKFGVEVEMTGITRKKTASVIAKYFNSVIRKDLLK